MRLNTDAVFDPKAVTHVRVDKIGESGGGLWWVALAFADGSTKPEGMFTSQADAMSLAEQLGTDWKVGVKVNLDAAAG